MNVLHVDHVRMIICKALRDGQKAIGRRSLGRLNIFWFKIIYILIVV
jgi:hypothetical protein